MADRLLKFKPITVDDVYKGLDKSYGTIQTASGYDLRWWYVDRENIALMSPFEDDMKNLFHSFGISREDQEDWFKVFNVTDYYNAKRMVIITLPQSGITSMIDGSTLEVNIPTGLTAGQHVTFYGSTFEAYPDPLTDKQISLEYADSVYGGAYCYLFANTYGQNCLPSATFEAGTHHPYTGNVNGAANPNAGENSWDHDAANVVPHLSASHWEEGDDGKDQPYGVALLDRGIIVLFDMYGRTDFIDNTILATGSSTLWTAAVGSFYADTFTGGSAESNANNNNRQEISFNGSVGIVGASVTYRTIDQAYKMVYFCHAGQAEFNSTSNHTYNQKKAYFRPEESDSLWITEVGLYDDNDDLLAYGKLSEPVEKNKLETMTFKVELQL